MGKEIRSTIAELKNSPWGQWSRTSSNVSQTQFFSNNEEKPETMAVGESELCSEDKMHPQNDGVWRMELLAGDLTPE